MSDETQQNETPVEHEDGGPDRLAESLRLSPRLVDVEVSIDGHVHGLSDRMALSGWGEVGSDGEVHETTLTGRVLGPIESCIRSGALSGDVTVDGIVYRFRLRFCPADMNVAIWRLHQRIDRLASEAVTPARLSGLFANIAQSYGGPKQ